MGRKAVGPVCCVMHVKEPRTLIVKEKGLAPVFLDSRLKHPAGWICARYKSYHYDYHYKLNETQTRLAASQHFTGSFITAQNEFNTKWQVQFFAHADKSPRMHCFY